MDAHAVVGKVSDVVISRAGRVNDKMCRQAFFIYKCLHNALGSRAAANIAQTHKKYFNRALGNGQARNKLVSFLFHATAKIAFFFNKICMGKIFFEE